MNTLTTITETNPCFLCCFCKSGLVDDINLGQLFMFEGVVTHYFCMLFSAALSQHGSDNEGILGFMPQDIMTEVRRSFRLRCTYCGSAGASVGCCNKRCRTAFHFPCGMKNGANFQFFGNYESYCSEHVLYPKLQLPRKDWVCPICTSPVLHRAEAIQSSCCKSAVFHKECLQKLALSSGYFFKCPMCNNGKEFVHEMRSLGVFVPEQDASWEREPNAYEELYLQHSQCDVPECSCPKGPSYSAQKGNWILARCRICGAAGTHKLCSKLITVDNWACELCLNVELRTEKDKEIKPVPIIKTEKVKKSRKKKVEVEMEQEAYVSARSCNRKVRNGRLQQKKPGKKSWKLSDIVVSPWCFWYFPYDKIRLEQFDAQSTLPDWRQLYLTVNLVNWIPKSLFQGGLHDSDVEEQISVKVPSPKKEEIGDQERAFISDSEIVTKRIPIIKRKCLKIRRRKAKKTFWGRGVIRKVRPKNRRPIPRNETTAPEQALYGTIHADEIPTTSGSSAPISPNSRIEVGSSEQALSTEELPQHLSKSNLNSDNNSAETLKNSSAEKKLWVSEAFQIDIQSNIEIPSDEDHEKSSSIDVPLLPPEPVPVYSEAIPKTPLLNHTEAKEATTEEEMDVNTAHIESPRKYVSKVLAINGTETPDCSKKCDPDDVLPLTELNSDVIPGSSPMKQFHINPVVEQENNQAESNQIESRDDNVFKSVSNPPSSAPMCA